MKRVRLTGIVTGLALIPLLIPTLIVLIASFSTGDAVTFPPKGFTTQWYIDMFANPQVWKALGSSLYVTVLSVVINVVCAVPAALVLPSVGRRSRALFTTLLTLGLSSPTIVSAFAYFDIFSYLPLGNRLTGLGIAIAVTCFPFMLWAVMSAIEDVDPELAPAAATMGSDPVEQFLFVRLPLLAPGIVTGGLIVFVLSITDFVISQVLTTVDDQTLPVYIYSGLRGAISPSLGAVSALFIGIAALVFAVVLKVGKVEQFLFRK